MSFLRPTWYKMHFAAFLYVSFMLTFQIQLKQAWTRYWADVREPELDLCCLFFSSPSLINRKDKPSSLIWMVPEARPRSPKHIGSITPVKQTFITAGQTEGTLASAPRTLSKVQVTSIPPHCQAHHFHWLSPWNQPLWREKLPIVPSAAARSSSVINDSATPLSCILQTPHSSFFESLSHFQLAASLLSIICHAWNLLMELTDGRMMERTDGITNLRGICIWVK